MEAFAAVWRSVVAAPVARPPRRGLSRKGPQERIRLAPRQLPRVPMPGLEERPPTERNRSAPMHTTCWRRASCSRRCARASSTGT